MPPGAKTRADFRKAITDVSFRTYHVSRMVQAYYENPVHDNLEDPFLETMYILLSWKTRIEDARRMLDELVHEFSSPRDILVEGNLPRIERIVGGSGFGAKRPTMLVELVRTFIDAFPDGDMSSMRRWKDDRILDFLDSIPGVGRKSALCVMMYSLHRPRFPVDAHVGRVLKRTRMLRELVEIAEDMEHRPLQIEVENLVPPSVRAPLHAGLISLGQEFCTSKPKCGDCPIRHTCAYYAEKEMERAEGKQYTHVDLFCGAGGFSAGFTREGFRTLIAIDKDEDACRTFRMNHPEMPQGNIQACNLDTPTPQPIIDRCTGWKEDLTPGKVDVITAGIPCQGFSKAGYRSRPAKKYDPHEDPRNFLYRPVIRWIRFLRPKYVVIENVPEIKSAGSDRSKILTTICRSLEREGYCCSYAIVNAADIGVPQTRYRLILIASRKDMPGINVQDIERYRNEPMTLGQAINYLPEIEANSGRWYTRTRDEVITAHVARYNNEEDLRIFEAIEPGERYEHFIERCSNIIEERRERREHAVYEIGSFSDKYYKLDPEKPSRTIVSHLEKDGNGYIHPSQVRSITPREAMRLQGFDNDYIFCGSRRAQFVQTGNAVPPPLARVVARLIKSSLRRAGGDEREGSEDG